MEEQERKRDSEKISIAMSYKGYLVVENHDLLYSEVTQCMEDDARFTYSVD